MYKQSIIKLFTYGFLKLLSDPIQLAVSFNKFANSPLHNASFTKQSAVKSSEKIYNPLMQSGMP